jgi:endoplasmic reticulum-Golgi intermediate compartment protein 3
LEMEFDITLPAVPCSQLQIDANDHHGQSQSLHLDRQHHVWKHRIKILDDKDGSMQLIGERSRLELGSTLKQERELIEVAAAAGLLGGYNESNNKDDLSNNKQDEPCGSCYGAGEEGECCNTCEDVRRAYKRRGWLIKNDMDISQCKKAAEQDQEGEGCNVHGIVALSTGGGNLHLAPGKDAATTEGFTILDMLMQSFQKWNVSHTIHKIRFGPEYPAMMTSQQQQSHHQLDGKQVIIEDTYGMYQYYFQIVPTRYKFRNGTILETNQYSVTEHLRHVAPGSNRGLPGVFFFYEVSPLHVEIKEGYRKGWIAFLTSVCAIVGGVVTVMGLLDQCLFATQVGGRRAKEVLLR